MMWFVLVFAAIKRYFDAAQPKADIDEEFHKTNIRDKVGKERVKYDLHYSKGRKNNVIVFCHGATSDETAWVTPDRAATKKWLAMQGTEDFPDGLLDDEYPHVLCLSFGWKWLLSPPGYDRRRGERDATVPIFKYLIEKHLKEYLGEGYQETHNLVLAGSSMGAHNVLQMYTHHPEMFDAFIAHNPLLLDYDWDDEGPADMLYKWEFRRGNYDQIAPNHPLAMQKIKADHPYPPLMIQASVYDEMKFYKPVVKYANELKAKGVGVQFYKNLGGHNDMDEVTVAAFLNHVFKKEETPDEVKPDPNVIHDPVDGE